jgi:hypothetical protein
MLASPLCDKPQESANNTINIFEKKAKLLGRYQSLVAHPVEFMNHHFLKKKKKTTPSCIFLVKLLQVCTFLLISVHIFKCALLTITKHHQ